MDHRQLAGGDPKQQQRRRHPGRHSSLSDPAGRSSVRLDSTRRGSVQAGGPWKGLIAKRRQDGSVVYERGFQWSVGKKL